MSDDRTFAEVKNQMVLWEAHRLAEVTTEFPPDVQDTIHLDAAGLAAFRYAIAEWERRTGDRVEVGSHIHSVLGVLAHRAFNAGRVSFAMGHPGVRTVWTSLMDGLEKQDERGRHALGRCFLRLYNLARTKAQQEEMEV